MAEDVGDALLGIERIARGDLEAGQADLLRIITHARAASADARAFAAAGLALADVLLRSDPRRALATLSPALVDADDERLADHTSGFVHAVAALAHALPDATLFDVGRVHAYAARADALAGAEHPEVAFLAWLAITDVALMVADDELLERAFAKRELAPWAELPSLLALHDAELRTLRASLGGQRGTVAKLSDEVISGAAANGYAILEARALSLHSLRRLDEFADVEGVLESTRRVRELLRVARASPGMHVVLSVRAEAEALFRAGRTKEALACLDELTSYTRETGLPPLIAVTTMVRIWYLTGRYGALAELATSLRACNVPSLRRICTAFANFAEGLRLLASSEDPERTVQVFEDALVGGKGWSFLYRDILVHACTAYVLMPNESLARSALSRAQRFLDRMPSPWASAHLRRAEGMLIAAHGDWKQARQLMESAIGTLESGGDLPDATFARFMMTSIGNALGDPECVYALPAATASLEAFGLNAPGALGVALDRFVYRRRTASGPPVQRMDGIEALVSPLQRLAVRGIEPKHLERELMAIAREAFPENLMVLEEVKLDAPPSSHSQTYFEFGDGAGRRLRLGVAGSLSAQASAYLTVLTTAAGLAFEVATLRGGVNVTSEDDVSIPGFIAASAQMRALRAEITRLAASRATVVITGESGTGKEVVARAIHDLSTRASKPYVAFNCAAVPRELFEGQLFGYKRGAFTGAVRDQPGVLGAADGGTIFLDEIGELPLDIQPKLLRFLENGEIFPLGEKRPRIVDVRVVAATHRDLAALVREQRFREDLYYRLQVIALRIARLRDRPEDIAPLARHFVQQLAGGSGAPILAPDALAKLATYEWPGNVRELRNVMERALAYTPGPTILRASHLTLGMS
jgi:hypothetical protein